MEGLARFALAVPILVIPGLYVLLRGIWLYKGGEKGAYFVKHIYAGRIYAYIPLGIMCLWWAIAAIPSSPDLSLSFVNIGIFFLILALLFNFLQPTFLKPAWLRWLEREHRDIWPLLVEDAHAMGLDHWEKRMQTQADLEEWVTEVRRKYGR